MASNITIPNTIGTQAGGTNVTPLLDANYAALVNAANNLNDASNYYADTGTANALVITIPAGQSFTVTDGLELSVKAANANTGAATITVNGTQYPIQAIGGAALSAGSIGADEVVKLIYNAAASAFHLQATVGTLISEVVVTATGAYSVTVPPGATMCDASLAGGGGTGAGNTATSGGGGGGAGGYVQRVFSVAGISTLTGTVGAAGGATSLTANGSVPGMTCGGGANGVATSNSSVSLGSGGAGGGATGGLLNLSGGTGSCGGTVYDPTNGYSMGCGAGAVHPLGYGSGGTAGPGLQGVAIFKFYK